MFGALAVSFTGDRAAAVQNHRVCEELKGRPIAMSVKALTDLCGA
jgi:hypothetical protein